ncbi:MAG: transcription termination/antitermination NusG family protein [Akkermansiaceae bacterium]|nr:transcription termination/antitermination NusG family protein [Akkermansiaceae bacterium]
MSDTQSVIPAEAEDHAWYCIRTKPKREHVAAKAMSQLEGVQSFCPRLRYRKATRRGKVWWVEAMFPGYVFAFFSRPQNERNIVHTHGVMTILKFGDYVPEIPGTFIADLNQQMQELSEGDEDVMTLEPAVNEGDEVEIAHGAFQGFQGTVIEVIPAQERVKLLTEFLGNRQVVETDLLSLLLPNKPVPE